MRVDFRLTPEGDLDLGPQQTDANGNLLYYQHYAGLAALPMETTRPGDGAVPIRDAGLVYLQEADLQLIKSRVQTDNPDWHWFPQVGANLSDLIGRRNNPATAAAGKAQILAALTYDNAFKAEDITIDAIPVGVNELLFDLRLTNRTGSYRFLLTLDVTIGVTNFYEA